MRFRIYDINKVVGQSTEKMEIKDVQQLFSMLNKFPRVEEGTVSYAPLYMKSYKQFLLGSQDHDTTVCLLIPDSL